MSVWKCLSGNNMIKKKTILLVGAYPPPYGGIASHLYDIAQSLSTLGYRIVTLTPSSISECREKENVRNIFVNQKEYVTKYFISICMNCLLALRLKKDLPFKDFIRAVCLSKIIDELTKGEIINAIFFYDVPNGFVIPIMKKRMKCKIPMAWMIFGDFYLEPEKYKKMSGFLYDLFLNCDEILSSSKYCGASIQKVLGCDFSPKVVYVGVDAEVYKQKRMPDLKIEMGIPANGKVILFFGRMTKAMGLDFLIENYRNLLMCHDHLYLIIAGAYGDLSEEAKRISTQEPRIKYYTNVPVERKLDFFALADIIIAPTMDKHACMGVSIKEAMAFGKPVVASTSGGIPEAIEDGANGFLVPIESGKMNVNIFIERVRRLMEDDDLRHRMGEVGREKLLNQFTNDITTREYVSIIDEMACKK